MRVGQSSHERLLLQTGLLPTPYPGVMLLTFLQEKRRIRFHQSGVLLCGQYFQRNNCATRVAQSFLAAAVRPGRLPKLPNEESQGWKWQDWPRANQPTPPNTPAGG